MILVDTNALLWLSTDDPKLGAKSRARLSEAERVFYSAISIAEIVIKHLIGRLAVPGGGRFPGVFDEMGLFELPLTAGHADAMREEAGLLRHDPFDRLLLAQARAERLTLLTADRALLAVGRSWIEDARC